MLVSIQFCLALVATWFVGTFAAVLPRAPMAGPKPYAVQQHLLDTDWTDKVGTEPWGEYPRPQLQRDKWQNLNGIWLYLKPLDILEQFSETNLPVWGDFAEKGREVLVPSCLESALSGVQERDAVNSWYRREFSISDTWQENIDAGNRFLLHFEAVDYDATVYLNGRRVGRHEGGYTSWSVDVTEHLKLKPEDKNELIVYVYDPTDKVAGKYIAVGKQSGDTNHIFYTPCSGIWQTVWLEPVPKEYITRFEVSASHHGDVTAMVTTSNFVSGEVEIKLHKDGEEKASAKGKPNEQFTFKVDNVAAWEPDSPNLYDMTITVGQDTIRSYTGFRTVGRATVQKIPRQLLNDKFIFQWGTLDQGYWPDGIYTPPTREAMRYDLEQLKKLGFNTVRKHVKIEPSLFYRDCDELGLMVIQDIPNPNRDTNLTPEAQLKFNREALEMVRQLRNHPSIVTWTLYNEGWGQGEGEPEFDLGSTIRIANGNTLIDAASGWHDHGHGDFSSNHFYPGPWCGQTVKGQNTPSPAWDQKRVAIQSEFGGLGTWPDSKNLWGDPETRATILETYEISPSLSEWNKRSKQILDQLVRQIEENGCSGAIWTQTTDVEGEVNGMMTYDRRILRADVEMWNEMSRKIALAAKGRGGGVVVDLDAVEKVDDSGDGEDERWGLAALFGPLLSLTADPPEPPQPTRDSRPKEDWSTFNDVAWER